MIFSKKPQPAPFQRRAADFRKAVYQAMRDCDVSGRDAASILEDIAQGLRLAHAMTAPLASATPRVFSGNLKEPKVNLRRLLTGHAE